MDHETRPRAERFKVVMSPDILKGFAIEQGAWYETQGEIEAGLRWGEEKARLLRWVRKQMTRRLTARERLYLELHFFEGLSFREAALRSGTNASSVHRGVTRALRKLRTAAAEGKITEVFGRTPRKG